MKVKQLNIDISETKQKNLEDDMESYGILESDLEERFIRGSGSGGQKINKTASTVQLKHLLTGFEVKCQRTRSQSANRYHARKLLVAKIKNHLLGKQSEEEKQREKIRRQKRKRSKRAKNKMLADKKKQSEKKQLRQKVL